MLKIDRDVRERGRSTQDGPRGVLELSVIPDSLSPQISGLKGQGTRGTMTRVTKMGREPLNTIPEKGQTR